MGDSKLAGKDYLRAQSLAFQLLANSMNAGAVTVKNQLNRTFPSAEQQNSAVSAVMNSQAHQYHSSAGVVPAELMTLTDLFLPWRISVTEQPCETSKESITASEKSIAKI